VSVVVPVRNGARWLDEVLRAVVAECVDLPHEVIVVDDGSEDASRAIAAAWAGRQVRVIDGPRRGASAAVNAGVRASRFPFIAQVDQDVVVRAGWLSALLDAVAEPDTAAAQGWYVRDPQAPLLARVMALDLEQRYGSIESGRTDHVCTGNVVWRRAAFDSVGGLDETLGYGYDNDLSYRLVRSGWRLAICDGARSYHRWRDDWAGYLAQQYGFGYGRLDLLTRHPRRVAGDRVSPGAMMAHPLLLSAALVFLVISTIAAASGAAAVPWAVVAALLVASLAFERTIAGLRAYGRSRDRAALMFPVAHLARDMAWVAAIGIWLIRRARGATVEPGQSMRPRSPHGHHVSAAGTE
jgi:cellulose synthase/poly-beta-1,6-N-acetylglucosamine synthase-like glycosyltransferase